MKRKKMVDKRLSVWFVEVLDLLKSGRSLELCWFFDRGRTFVHGRLTSCDDSEGDLKTY